MKMSYILVAIVIKHNELVSKYHRMRDFVVIQL